jgi:hypothetical protein
MGPVRVGGTARVAAAAALGLGLVLALAACDSEPDPGATSTSTNTPRNAAPPPGGDADMVTAFSATRGPGQPGLVELKFKLTKRPAVGEPVDIQLELVPTVDLERLFARFQVAEGLQIVSGAESDHFEHPAKGVPVGHKMTVTPRADGIFYVTAVVLADSDKESVARTFSFPLIAGQGLLEQPAAASVAEPKQAAARP